ncbi:hypothetical protein [Pseudomonas sp. FME51]|uniref:hypothetical protein n=1 Tax=Pseudomonas sp. FME51 TaxID=2742609 RepID=UPI0018692F46|nr:hypothetical protein [Pseudomonas sp. FME51]
MSPTLIAALVVGGLIILICIGFLNQTLERSRLERARALAELRSRINCCVSISHDLPGQFMSAELKTQLLQIEATLLERLIKLDGKNASHVEQLSDVRQQLDKGEPRIANAPLVITDEAAAQQAKQLLGDLLQLFEQSRRDGVMDSTTFQRWSQLLNQHLLQTTLTMYQAMANAAMQAGKPRVAKLQYERAIAYLNKQQHPDSGGQLAVFRQLLANAEQTAASIELAAEATTSELSAGIEALEEDDEAWKKKTIYD